jgi:hypothetical protein
MKLTLLPSHGEKPAGAVLGELSALDPAELGSCERVCLCSLVGVVAA